MSALVGVALLTTACTPQSREAFDALLAASNAAATPAAEAAGAPTPAADPGGAWFSHRDGYALQLPSGWEAVRLTSTDIDALLDALAVTHPAAARDVDAFLGGARLQVSSLAREMDSADALSPFVAVLSQTTEGLRPGQVASRVMSSIEELPGIAGEVARSTDHLPAGESARFLFRLEHAELGTFVVRGNLFRFGGAAYLVLLAAPEASFAAAEPDLALILQTLRFGV
jgi:hypothetical protein